MSMNSRKSSLTVGRRTRVNILAGKKIRKLEDGGDVFEDYWTDSEEEHSVTNSETAQFINLSMNSDDTLSPDLSDFKECVSEPVSCSIKQKLRSPSNTTTMPDTPVSSTTCIRKRQVSFPTKNSSKNMYNLNKELLSDTSELTVSKQDKNNKTSIMTSISSPLKNSEIFKSLEKTHVKSKSVLEKEKIISSYDKYDALVMQLINEGEESSNQISPEQIFTNLNNSDDNYHNKYSDLPVAQNLDVERGNFHAYDETRIINDENKENNKPEEINSLQQKKSPEKNDISENRKELTKNSSPYKLDEKTQTKLNSSLNSNEACLEEDEKSSRESNILDINKETPRNVHSSNECDSNSKRSKVKSNISTTFNKSDRYEQIERSPRKNMPKNKKKTSRNKSLQQKKSPENNDISENRKELSKNSSPYKLDEKMQTKLNSSLKSNEACLEENEKYLRESNNLEINKETPRNVHSSNEQNSNSKRSKVKSNISTTFNKSDRYEQIERSLRKNIYKNKKKTSRNKSLHLPSNEHSFTLNKSQIKLNNSSRSEKSKRVSEKNASECHGPENSVKFVISNKKQKISMNKISENEEMNVSHTNNTQLQQTAMKDSVLQLEYPHNLLSEKSDLAEKRHSIDDNGKILLKQLNSSNQHLVHSTKGASFESECLNNSHDVQLLSKQHVNDLKKHSVSIKLSERQVSAEKEVDQLNQFHSDNNQLEQLVSNGFSSEQEQYPHNSSSITLSPEERKKHSHKSKNIERKSNRKIIPRSSSANSSDQVHQSSEKNIVSEQKQQSPTINNNARRNSKAKSTEVRKEFISGDDLRRSARQRYSPLARWRNQRLRYRFESGEIKILGIDNGTKEDDAPVQQILQRMYCHKFIKKEKIPQIRNIIVHDAKHKKKIRAEIYKPFPSVSWDNPKGNNGGPASYRIKRLFETSNTSFGYLEIKAFERKPQQYMPDEDLHLTLIKGNVEVQVDETIFKPKYKDMLIIPRSVPYSIINNNKKCALLLYSVGKFKFLENEK